MYTKQELRWLSGLLQLVRDLDDEVVEIELLAAIAERQLLWRRAQVAGDLSKADRKRLLQAASGVLWCFSEPPALAC